MLHVNTINLYVNIICRKFAYFFRILTYISYKLHANIIILLADKHVLFLVLVLGFFLHVNTVIFDVDIIILNIEFKYSRVDINVLQVDTIRTCMLT